MSKIFLHFQCIVIKLQFKTTTKRNLYFNLDNDTYQITLKYYTAHFQSQRNNIFFQIAKKMNFSHITALPTIAEHATWGMMSDCNRVNIISYDMNTQIKIKRTIMSPLSSHIHTVNPFN